MREANFTKPLTVSLTEEQYSRIKEISDNKKISMADWIRKALDQVLAGNYMTGGSNGHGKI